MLAERSPSAALRLDRVGQGRSLLSNGCPPDAATAVGFDVLLEAKEPEHRDERPEVDVQGDGEFVHAYPSSLRELGDDAVTQLDLVDASHRQGRHSQHPSILTHGGRGCAIFFEALRREPQIMSWRTRLYPSSARPEAVSSQACRGHGDE